jgi:transmembrane sensor
MNANELPNNTDIKSQARAWWVRVDSGMMTASEQVVFDAWLNTNPLHQDAFDQVNYLWLELDGLKEQFVPLLPVQAAKPRRLVNWQWGMTAIATCCLLLMLCNPMTLWLRADMATDIGEMRTEVLADGSTVLLNSESALSVAITSTSRQLTLLKGEALFTVSPDPTRPFQVHAGNGTITALGTAFNVHYNHDSTEITVTEHSVAVNLDQSSATNPPPIVVASGQQVFYTKDRVSDIKTVDAHIATAWERGKLIFQEKPLGEVIAELNHYHRGYFLISDPQITQRRVNGVFSTDKPIAAFNAIEQSLHLHSNRISHYLVLLHR